MTQEACRIRARSGRGEQPRTMYCRLIQDTDLSEHLRTALMVPADQKTASGWTERLQSGLQFTTVRCRPGRTDHGCWSAHPRDQVLKGRAAAGRELVTCVPQVIMAAPAAPLARRQRHIDGSGGGGSSGIGGGCGSPNAASAADMAP